MAYISFPVIVADTSADCSWRRVVVISDLLSCRRRLSSLFSPETRLEVSNNNRDGWKAEN